MEALRDQSEGTLCNYVFSQPRNLRDALLSMSAEGEDAPSCIRDTGIEQRGAAIRGENGKQSELVRTNSGCLPFSFFVFGTRKRQILWRHPYESAS